MNDKFNSDKDSANRDPITGEPGAHPVGTGVGAAVGGAATGAAVGTVAGAVVGGLAGKAAAEKIDPTVESAYWRDNYTSRPYVKAGESFNDYGPAYEYGVSSSASYDGRDFDDVEADLSRDWGNKRGASSLTWERARQATRDAWDRVRRAVS